MDAYLEAAGLRTERKASLFLTTRARSGQLTERPFTRNDALRMVLPAGEGRWAQCARVLRHVPSDGHHRVPRERRDGGEHPGDRGTREPARDEAL
jgi:hypothetical protein